MTATSTPVTIVTGFLGSGKTTIILHLVEQLQSRGEQVVYIKNELGNQDIDTQIIKTTRIETRELLNGCICCTLVGPFTQAIDELIARFHPDRVIIEASGAADPSAIALTVSSHPGLRRDGVVSIIDVANFEGYQDISTTAQHQAQFTDLIVFNKVELVDEARKMAVVGYVRELNQYAPIVEAVAGKLDPELVFGCHTTELEALLQTHPDHHQHLTMDQLTSCSFDLATPPDKQSLEQALSHLPKQVFRIKGIITDTTGQTWLVNKVGSRLDLQSITPPSGAPLGRLVCLGFDVTNLAPEIEHQWRAAGLDIKLLR